MKTITISECRSNGYSWTSTHRTDDTDEAVQRAIRKHFGSKHRLYRSNELSRQGTVYGQIGYYVPKVEAATMVTGRVRIDIE